MRLGFTGLDFSRPRKVIYFFLSEKTLWVVEVAFPSGLRTAGRSENSPQTLGVFSPHLPCKISEANFRQLLSLTTHSPFIKWVKVHPLNLPKPLVL